jgi:hypothetical protein
LMYNFCLFNPPESPRSVYRFLVMFCFELFCQELILSLGEPWPLEVMTKAKDPGNLFT